MAKDDKKQEALTPSPAARETLERNTGMTATATEPGTAAPQVAPKPVGFFDEVKRVAQAQDRGGEQRHTFGAWARAKGVRPEQVLAALKKGKGKLEGFEGDGPEMTEREFDEAVGFEYRTTFGAIPGLQTRTHIPAPTREGDTAPSEDDLRAQEGLR